MELNTVIVFAAGVIVGAWIGVPVGMWMLSLFVTGSAADAKQ